jgi:5-methylcytosine-specific restriction protein A
MSTMRRTPGIYASKAPTGPNGERLCRNCHGPMPTDKRKHNCSTKCSEEWMCKTSPSHMRRKLYSRDKGVCASCGLDTVALKKEYRLFRDGEDRGYDSEYGGKRPLSERIAWLRERGVPYGRVSSDWWDADHIVPVIEGGGECGIDNFRTLCIPCHKAETAALRKRMARRRIEAKEVPLLLVESEAK